MSVACCHLLRSRSSTTSVTLVEAIDASGGIHELLFTRKERVTLGTNFDMKFFAHRGAGLKRMTASAADVDLLIIRMYFLFHCSTVLIWPIKANTDNKPHFDVRSSQKVFQPLFGNPVERLNRSNLLLQAIIGGPAVVVPDSNYHVVLRSMLGRNKLEYLRRITSLFK